MELNERLDKFEKLVSEKSSNFLSKLAYYNANKKWIDQSSKVAINVLEALKHKGLSQKDLAQKMNISAQQVNKIIKGKQNLTFETIGKLENALEISIMEIIDYKHINEIETISTQIKTVSKTLTEEFIRRDPKKAISHKTTQMKVVYNKRNYSRSSKQNQYPLAN